MKPVTLALMLLSSPLGAVEYSVNPYRLEQQQNCSSLIDHNEMIASAYERRELDSGSEVIDNESWHADVADGLVQPGEILLYRSKADDHIAIFRADIGPKKIEVCLVLKYQPSPGRTKLHATRHKKPG